MESTDRRIFTAVSSSVRHLTQILRCISFCSKTHAQISNAGIRFSVQESRVMQGRSEHFLSSILLIVEGFAFLQKELFSSYIYHTDPGDEDHPILQISLESLLETLQIFGINESTSKWSDNSYGGLSNSTLR